MIPGVPAFSRIILPHHFFRESVKNRFLAVILGENSFYAEEGSFSGKAGETDVSENV